MRDNNQGVLANRGLWVRITRNRDRTQRQARENHSTFASPAALNHSSVVILRPVALFSSSSVAVPTPSPAAVFDVALAKKNAANSEIRATDKVFM
jgi:hypothetical protein